MKNRETPVTTPRNKLERHILDAIGRSDWKELRLLTRAIMGKFPRKAPALYYVDYINSLNNLGYHEQALSHRDNATKKCALFLKGILFRHFADANIALGRYGEAYADFRREALLNRRETSVVDVIREWVKDHHPAPEISTAFLQSVIGSAEGKRAGNKNIPAKAYIPGLREVLEEIRATPT